MTFTSSAMVPSVGTPEIPGMLLITYEATTASPGPNVLLSEATMLTVTGPCKAGSLAPKLAIRTVGEITSPGWRVGGTLKAVPWRSGSGSVIVAGVGTRKTLLAVEDSTNVLALFTT